MMSALRKKMDSNSGLPPSILQMRTFWDQMTEVVQVWATKTTDLEVFCEITVRKVLSARAVNELLGDDVTFMFASQSDTGPSAMIVDQALVAQCAAKRFGDDVETMTTSSQVFLKLACESAAIALCETISSDVLMQTTAPSLGVPKNFIVSEGQFIGDEEYLHVSFKVVLALKETSIRMLFPIDAIRGATEKRWKALTELRDGSGENSHTALRKSVRTSSITVSAVLDQLTMSVGECSRLNIGQILPLPNADTKYLRLSTETLNGPLDITHGEMGIWKDARAVKLASPVSNVFLRNIADL